MRFGFRGTLRLKLAIAMVFVALLPLAISSLVATRVVLGGLEQGLAEQSQRGAQIAENLLLRYAQRVAEDAVSLSESPELEELLLLQPLLLNRFLQQHSPPALAGHTEIIDKQGRSVAIRSMTNSLPANFKADTQSSLVVAALGYQHGVTLVRLGNVMAVQAAAPVVDDEYMLRGAVLITVPLDARIAHRIKGVVGTEVAFWDGETLRGTFEQLPGATPISNTIKATAIDGAPPTVSADGEEFLLAFSRLQTSTGTEVGHLIVGVNRAPLAAANRSSTRTLLFGTVIALFFALVVAAALGRRISTPLVRLTRRVREMTRGRAAQPSDEPADEIVRLEGAFQQMTVALDQHQTRLAESIRELSTLHDIGRAVSSVLGLDEVLRIVVQELSEVLAAEAAAIYLTEGDAIELRAWESASSSRDDPPEGWSELARRVAAEGQHAIADRLLILPLRSREGTVGALLLTRAAARVAFSEDDVRMSVTSADQAASAISNARLFDQVSRFSANLEQQVEARTRELRSTNEELARTINELRDTQGQLIHSERMAGLGTLVTGIAHEINTPAGAIQGAVQTLGETLERFVERCYALMDGELEPHHAARVFGKLRVLWERLGQGRLAPPTQVRRQAKKLVSQMNEAGVRGDVPRLARRLAMAGAADVVEDVILLRDAIEPVTLIGLIEDLSFLARSAKSVTAANDAVVGIVRALRTYAHADQEATREVDLTEGIETTLTILRNELRYGIQVEREYRDIPRVFVFVDELNQVWTNLIQNAAHALGGEGVIRIETFAEGSEVGVRISDSGPGIPKEVLPRIFDAFYSTKPRGEGTGLGLGIARKIVEKHGGQIAVESRPGKTTFTVTLPMEGVGAPKDSSPDLQHQLRTARRAERADKAT